MNLVAPAAVRVVDLEKPLADIELPRTGPEGPFRSVLVVARLYGDPLGTAVIYVESDGLVSRQRLALELRRALGVKVEGVRSVRDLRRGNRRSGGPSVSVVVPTCGDTAAVERCVRSILASDYDRLEVIVVENRPRGSVTSRMLAERFADESRLHYIEEPCPGASRARNAGLAQADGEVVAFADDDVVVDRDWIRRAVEAFEHGDDIACVTGLILPLELETESQVRLEQFMTLGKGFRRQVYRLPEARIEHPLLPYTPGLIGSGANTVLRADAIRLLGGFDPTLGPATPAVGGEDLDIYIRLLQQGHAVAYEPSAIVWHEHPDSAELLRRQVYRYGIGLGATLTKQLVVGPDRRRLLSAVPAGIRYARDPESRKNAGKSDDFPRRLDWLERLGMAVGPAAYVASALLRIPRRAASPLGVTTVDGQTLYVGQLTLPSGDTVRVVEVAPATVARPATSHLHTRAAEGAIDRAATAAALGACVAAPIAVALGLPPALRFAAVLALLCLAPGTALMWALRGRAELALTLGVSLGVTVVLAESMLWLGFWHPQLYLYGLAGICLPPLVSRVRLSRRGPAEMAFRRAREAVANAPRATVGHLALLAAAVALWGVSLAGADLSRMAGIGLLDAMPSSFFFAFVLIVVGFAVAASADEVDTRLLALYLLALILVLQGTTAILYDEPRYPSVYKHLGVINLISVTHAVQRDIDVYNNWPAFFAANAWLSGVTGLGAIHYAGWAQLFFSLANVAAVRFAIRGVTADERVALTGAWFFVLGNWVGQDYLAPQGFGFLLSLVVLGLCLRCSPPTPRARSRLVRALMARDEEQPPLGPPPLAPGGAVAVGGICFLAVVMSHQLSPLLLILSVGAIWLCTRRVPGWILLAMVAVEAWWVSQALPFIESRFAFIDPGSPGARAAGFDLGHALPGAVLTFYSPAGVIGLMLLLALIGGIRRLRAGKRDVAAACLVVAPFLGFAIQSYGGEGLYRCYLFALPWLAFFAVAACSRAPVRQLGPPLLPRLALGSCALGVCLLFAVFGAELVNHVSADEVRAQVWYEQHAPAHSVAVFASPQVPTRVTARYPVLGLGVPNALFDRPAFRGHLLGRADIPRLERFMAGRGGPRQFLILSRRQADYGRLNGLVPKGSIATLRRALSASSDFRLVYRQPSAWIYEYLPRGRPR